MDIRAPLHPTRTRRGGWRSALFGIAVMIACSPSRGAGQQLTLQDALGTALRSHPLIRSADAGVDVERARKWQALSPSPAEVVYRNEEIRPGEALGTGAQRILQVSQSIDIPLLLGARGWKFEQLARAASSVSTHTRSLVRASVIKEYSLLYARQQQAALLDRTERLMREFAAKAGKREQAGDGTRLESLRASAEMTMAQLAAARGRRDRAATLRALSRAMGTELPESVVAADSLVPRAMPLPAEDAEGAQREHPLAQAARFRAAAARDDASWRWLTLLPSFRAGLFRQDIASIGRFWGAEVSVAVPLWFLLDQRGQIEEHRALAAQADDEALLARMETRAAFASARDGLRVADETLRACSAGLLDEAAEIDRTARAAYEAGQIGALEFIDAQRSANTIRLAYFDALAAWYAAVADYELASESIILQ